MSKKKKETRILVKKDIIIKAGTELSSSPVKREYLCPHYEEILAFGKDYTATFTIDIDSIENNSEYFEIM
jgi:hypothetical protein